MKLRLLVFALVLFFSRASNAQFSRPVVLLKGKAVAQNAAGVVVSVCAANDTVRLVESRANSVDGRYLIVLQPKRIYRLRAEAIGCDPLDMELVTPDVSASKEIVQDFELKSAAPLAQSGR